MSNSSLISYTNIAKNYTKNRNHSIDTITIHCVVGQWTAKKIADYFATTDRQASCNYGIGKDGDISLCVEEKDRSWCSSNGINDHRAITIEVASDTTAPYKITDKALDSLIKLCADICKRNNIKKLIWSNNKNDRINHVNGVNMTCHRDFAPKACPGDYIYNKEQYIADEVNKLLGVVDKPIVNNNLTKQQYIEQVAKFVNKYKDKYGICVVSPIISQFCLESGYGTSELAKNAENYCGMKHRPDRVANSIGIYYKVGSEQNADGSYSSSAMQWEKFENLEKCVEGYFQFLFSPKAYGRYNNLKGITDCEQYLTVIRADCYATSLDYVSKCMNVVRENNLTRYDDIQYHTVVKGDTLIKIASKYGLKWEKIAEINNIKEPYIIKPGQKIKLK